MMWWLLDVIINCRNIIRITFSVWLPTMIIGIVIIIMIGMITDINRVVRLTLKLVIITDIENENDFRFYNRNNYYYMTQIRISER